jgi:hypothetical protein
MRTTKQARARLAAMAEELTAPAVAAPRKAAGMQTTVATRLPPDMAADLERLRAALSRPGFDVKLADALRLALAEGLPVALAKHAKG